MTDAMKSALLWLRARNGDGLFDRTGVLVAGGERAPIIRSTWNRLSDLGLVEFYMGKKRVRVTNQGYKTDLVGVDESGT